MPKIDTDVGQLVDMIGRGELRLPELQRRYVWPATRVRDLLDSLYRNYPSGTILVWDAPQDIPTKDLSVEQEKGGFTPKLLLDGQQRLTSLAAVSRGQPIKLKNRVRPIDIAFNIDHPEGPPVEVLEVEGDEASTDDGDGDEGDDGGIESTLQERLRTRTFVVANSALLSDPRWIRVTDIFGGKTDWDLLKGLVSAPDDPKYDLYSKRLQRVRGIKKYPYVMHVLERDLSYEEVAEIFVRVNSLGMKLRGSDLALAQITARWQNSLQLFEEFAEECEKYWFTFDLGVLVRTLVVFATKQSRFRTVGSISQSSLGVAWEQAKEGIRFAINFLRSNAGIEDESLLSSPLLAIPIAVFAVLKEHQLSQSEERDLLRWLFVANAKGHFSGSSETVLDNDLSILFKGGTPADLLSALEQQVGRLRFEAGDFRGRSWRHPLFPVSYLALKSSGAKDWRSGLTLSLNHQGKTHSVEYHHIFAKSLLRTAGFDTGEINEIANMAFVSGSVNRAISNKAPDEYLPGIVEGRGEDALVGQRVPLDESLWKIENYRLFLEHRRAELAAMLNDFVDGIAADRMPSIDISTLIGDGESAVLEFKSAARYNSHTNGVDKRIESAIVKSVAGFMNADGGTLLIGVNDAGIAIGIDHDLATLAKKNRDGFELFLTQLVGGAVGKDGLAHLSVHFESTNGLDVCAVRVQRGAQPVYVSEDGERRFYVRTGNSTSSMPIDDAIRYIEKHWKR